MSGLRKVCVLVLALSGLAGCQDEARILLESETVSLASGSVPPKVHNIFVATSRKKLPDGINFAEDRGDDVSYGRYRISVPPNHKPGAIEWPTRSSSVSEHFATIGAEGFGGKAEFISQLNATVAQQPANHKEAAVFIHGFNTNFVEGLYRFAQMVHDFDMKGIPVHFSWPSLGKPRGYVYDRDSTQIARDALEETFDAISRSDVQGLTIVAHSMGGLLTVETLRQMAITGNSAFRKKLNGIILISPDIDPDLFRAQVSRIEPLPKPFVIFVSSKDKALRLSATITGQAERVGSLHSAEQLEGLDITLIDVTNVEGGDSLGHMTAATSPEMIRLVSEFKQGGQQGAALWRKPKTRLFGGAGSARAGSSRRIVLAPGI